MSDDELASGQLLPQLLSEADQPGLSFAVACVKRAEVLNGMSVQ